MKVLWILNGCGLEGRGITGGPVRFHEISRRWRRDGRFDQHLLTTPGGETMLRGMGCELDATVTRASFVLKREPCRPFRLWSYIVTALTCGGALKRLPKSDVEITASDYFCDIVPAMRLKKKTGCKWVAWIHHKETPPSKRPGFYLFNLLTWKMQEWSFRRIARHADEAWIYTTDAGDLVEERLLAYGMPAERIRRMKCGINLADIQAAPEPAKKTVDAVMIGVRPNKGLWDIVPIWKKVLAKVPTATLRLMGGMSGTDALFRQIAAEGLEKAITVFRPEKGFLPSDEYYAKIKEARLLFTPSHEEGWGIVHCEAMAADVPVVAYDLPVYRRIYGDALTIVPTFDFDAFAAAVVRLLTDADEYARMQKRGTERASTYDWDALALADAEHVERL